MHSFQSPFARTKGHRTGTFKSRKISPPQNLMSVATPHPTSCSLSLSEWRSHTDKQWNDVFVCSCAIGSRHRSYDSSNSSNSLHATRGRRNILPPPQERPPPTHIPCPVFLHVLTSKQCSNFSDGKNIQVKEIGYRLPQNGGPSIAESRPITSILFLQDLF
jgi:hypothetical protein